MCRAFRWVNKDGTSSDALGREYERDLDKVMNTLGRQHQEEFEVLRFGSVLNADNIVVFMPYGYRLVCVVCCGHVDTGVEAGGGVKGVPPNTSVMFNI